MDGNTTGTQNQTQSASRVSFGDIVSTLLQLLALSVPMAYLCGQAYRSAWLSGLGLDESLSRLSFEGYVHEGFVSLYAMAGLLAEKLPGEGVWHLWVVSFVCVAIAVVLVFGFYRLSKRTQAKIKNGLGKSRTAVDRASDGFRISLSIVIGSVLLAILPLFLMVALLYLIVPALGAEAAGRAAAYKTWLEALGRSEQPRDFPTITIADGDNVSHRAKVIECADWCIVFDRDQFAALAKDQIKRIDGAKAKLSAKP